MPKLLVFMFLLMLVACSGAPIQNKENSTPQISMPIAQSAGENPSSPTAKPVLSTPTVEKLPTSPITKTIILPSPASTPAEAFDLSNFVNTWNSGNLNEIRSLYTRDARFFPESEIQNLHQGNPLDVLVSSTAFADRVKAYQGMTLRLIGEPISIYDKLVAFLYRWENDTDGYDGAALLRYENGRVFLHSLIQSDSLSPNPMDDASYVDGINLDDLMNAWGDADLTAAQEVYTDDPVILSDEDLTQANWRDFTSPPGLNQLLRNFSGWKPMIIESPKRIGDLVIFTWRWQAFDFPLGHGVRLVHVADGQIDADLRYAIRPWEARGNPFLEP